MDEFSPAQQQALAVWAKTLSDHRLEVTRNQLLHAISRFDKNKDDAMTGLALCARFEAITAENDHRGIVRAMIPLCIPWGKPLDTVAEWSLTDFTKVPPTDQPPHVQAMKSQAATEADNASGPATTFNRWTASHYLAYDGWGTPQPVSGTLYEVLKDLADDRIRKVNAVAAEARLNHDVQVTDCVNDEAEAEHYRLADNDTSGLPIVSSDIIDVDNDFWNDVQPANDLANNPSGSANLD